MMLRRVLGQGGRVVGALHNRPLSSQTPTPSAKGTGEWAGEEKGYKYVNPHEPGDSFTEITDRVSATLFWTELFRG